MPSSSSRKSLASNAIINIISIFSSRFFGLFRDIVLAAYWGCTEAPQAAFNAAFVVPNMLRMLFGEGAFSAAFVPMITENLQDGRKKEAETLASRTITLQCLVLSLLVLLAICIAFIMRFFMNSDAPEHVRLIFKIFPILMPYAIFICMAGAFGAILNCLKKFAAPSLNPIIFNLFQIAAIGFLFWGHFSRHRMMSLYIFCFSVFCAGVAQMLCLWFICRRQGFDVRLVSLWDRQQKAPIWKHHDVQLLCRRIAPGLISAGVFQLNAFIDKSLAVFLGPAAVGSLGYCQHLVYLPIGIFGVAISTVCLPMMSSCTSEKERGDCLDDALRLVLFMTLPCTALLAVLATPVVSLLFQRGAFDTAAVRETVYAMSFLLPGLPAFCVAKVAVTTHHGRKDVKTPVKISLWCIALNFILNLSLSPFLRQGGLAFATAICSWINIISLLVIDAHKMPEWNWGKTLLKCLRLAAAAACAAMTAWLTLKCIAPHLNAFQPTSRLLFIIMTGGLSGSAAYILFCIFFRASEWKELLSGFIHRSH